MTKPLPGDRLFIYICSTCMASGLEYVRRIQPKWSQIVELALYRMQTEDFHNHFQSHLQNGNHARSENQANTRRGIERQHQQKHATETTADFFHLTEDIFPWTHMNWRQLLPGRLNCCSKEKRESKITAALLKHPKRFSRYSEKRKCFLWRLRKRRPPAAPKFWLPENGIPLTARHLDETAIQLGIKFTRLRSLSDKHIFPVESVAASDLLKKSSQCVSSTTTCNQPALQISYSSSDTSLLQQTSGTLSQNLSSSSLTSSMSQQSSHVPLSGSESTDMLNHVTADRNRNHVMGTAERNKTSFILGTSNSTEIVCGLASIADSTTIYKACFSDSQRPSAAKQPKIKGFRSSNSKVVSLIRRGKFGSAKTLSRLETGDGSKDVGAKVEGDIGQSDISRSLQHPKNVVDKDIIDEISGNVVSFSQLETSVGQYFGAMSRLSKGERFQIRGRRLTSGGLLQYLVEWENEHY